MADRTGDLLLSEIMSRRTTAILTIGLFTIGIAASGIAAAGLITKLLADAIWWGQSGLSLVLWMTQNDDDDGDDDDIEMDDDDLVCA